MKPTIFITFGLFLTHTSSFAKTCSSAKLSEIRETAKDKKAAVHVNCSATLSAGDVITKQLIFQGSESSGVELDCAGAKLTYNQASPEGNDRILIRSKKVGNTWIRPENVTVRNCHLTGSIRVYGMATNGEGPDLRDSSRLDNKHTARAQNNAPKNVLLENLTIIGTGRIPFYVSPGASYVTLKNSRISGKSVSTGIYFDAESAHNSLINNIIDPVTKRELVALDGSAFNLITGNYFSSLNHGGIYLYRNCGEGGTIRHQSPHSNQILNNTFYYHVYTGDRPAIFLGSRNTWMRPYCFFDFGYPWGSSKSNLDYATNNVVADNQFFVRRPEELIRSSIESNKIFGNRTVTKRTVKKNPCFSTDLQILLQDSESHFLRKSASSCFNLTCADGTLKKASTSCSSLKSCPLKIPVTGSCQYDVGLFRNGERGGVVGHYRYNEDCTFSTRVVASYNGADSGLIRGNSNRVTGDRGYRYTSIIDRQGLVVVSSSGRKVCELKF